jgi:uncharacterized repeat protein (TIGR02543 family)
MFGLALTFGLLLAGCPQPTEDPPKTYTVSYAAGEGGGSPPGSQTVAAGAAVTLPGQGSMTAPSGKVFNGWAADGASYAAGSSYAVNGNVTFIAQWTNAGGGTTYIVTYAAGEGGGSPPGNQTVAAGVAISLPAQGSMTAPSGKVFNGWAAGGASYAAGSSYTVNANVTFTAQWVDGGTPITYVVTYDAQGGSASQSTAIVAAGGHVADLPTATKSGYTFDGWFTQINGGGSQFTAGTPVNGNITVYAKWTNSGGNTGPEGVYVGIISFAGYAQDITGGTPILLDAAGKDLLNSKITNEYTLSTQSGTALFYAVHRALANLTAMTTYPAQLESVNVITFTDGLDNGSVGMADYDAIEDKRFPSDLPGYAAYVDGQIDSRTIAGKPITAYSVGVIGGDVESDNISVFRNNLEKIASAGKSTELTEFNDLQATLAGIAENLQVVHSNTFFNMKTTMLPSGTKVRMTFDIINTDSASAAGSSRYLEGTITSTGTGANMVYTFNNITYGWGLGSTQGAGPIVGVLNVPEVIFSFSGMTGYDPSVDSEQMIKQWTMPPEESSWHINREYNTSGATNTQVEERSAIIYLVLDSSSSLNETNIEQIRGAALEFIESLYERLNGGS